MKSLNLQFGDNRQNQREDLFLANIAEKIQSGKINLISFVDQAQFIDLMQQKQKKKVKIQPAFTKILNIVKENLAKHQQSQQKINEVSYEIKTISSTRQLGYRTSFNVGNKSGGLLQHKDSNIKEHFTNDYSEKELQVQQILDDQIKIDRSNGNKKLQQLIVNKNDIPKFNPQTLKTTNDNSQDLILKQDNISTGRNDKQNFNLLTQEQSDNSQSQLKLESSQKTCYLSLGKQLLNTNNSQEGSNLNLINSSATFQQLKQQEQIEPKTTTSRKQSDVIIKSIKGTIHQKNYLLNENDLQQRKNLTPVSQTSNQINSTSDKVNNSKNYNQQQQNNLRSKNSSRASNQKELSIQKKNSKQQKSKHNKIKSQQEQKSQQLVILQPKQSLAQIKIITDEEEHLQKIQNQETSFCGQIQSSQKLSNIENDYKQQESPQFQKNDDTDDAIIGQSTQFLYKKSNRQTISYKPEQNPLNVSQHSFQSKRHTIDQYDINSLMPPCSSRTLTSAKKEKTEQRNSTSNNSENDQKQKNQLGVPFKRGSKRMKSHNVQGNEDLQQEQKKKRRYSQERLFKSENRFERLEDERFQTVNNLEQSQSSSDQNNQDNDNNTPINIQISKCDKNDGRENIIEEESDGSFKQHQGILFATQDRMLLKIGDHSFYPQSSSRSVVKSNVPNTPAGSINTVHHSSSGTGTGLGTVQVNQNQRKRKQQQQQQQQSQNKKNNNLLLSTEFSQTKIQFQKQKSEDSYYEKEYTNESSQEPEKPSRLKPKKIQQKLSPPTLQIQTQRRKSSAQISPMDPRKLEQQERERLKQLEYQKQIERMKFERELMEQYKIPEEMPLIEKKQKIESLIGELSHQHDQDVKYQVQLYNERQDQIQNIQKNYEEKIDFRYNIVNSCYYEMDYLCDHKLKLKQKDQEGQKIFHLKFQDQNINLNAKNLRDGDKQEDEEASPYKKQLKIVSSYDPVEIENQQKRKIEFETESEMLQFLRIFQQEFGKQVFQCTLDFPMKDNQSEDRQVTRGFIPRNFKRKQTKQVTHKIEIGNYQLDQNKTNYLKQKANQIQKMGQFLLMDS